MTPDKDATDKLLDHNRQQLSALIDGELSPDEARFLLRRLQHDESLAQSLSRWQLCGDILRGHAHAPAPAGFAQGVAKAIAGAPGVAGAMRPTAGWRPARWGAGLALAASVAVVALFVVRQTPELAAPGNPGPAPGFASQQPAGPGPATAPAGDVAGAAAGSSGDAIASTAAGDVRQPRPQRPGTQPPGTPGNTEIAAVAAVAELPRRAAALRSRSQSQRAALRGSTRRDDKPQIAIAAATARPAESRAGQGQDTQDTMIAAAAVAPSTANPPAASPFAPKAGAITTRPWPRALLPGAGGSGFNVDYGRRVQSPEAFYPFQWHLAPQQNPAPSATSQSDASQEDLPSEDRTH